MTTPSPIRRIPGRDAEAELLRLRARFARVSRRIDARIKARKAARRWLPLLAVIGLFCTGGLLAAMVY